MEITKDHEIKVEMKPRKWMRFALKKIGLHVFDIRNSSDSKSVNLIKTLQLFTSVNYRRELEELCTCRSK